MPLTRFCPSGVNPARVSASYVHLISTTLPAALRTISPAVTTYANLSRTWPPGTRRKKPLGGSSLKSSLSIITVPEKGILRVPSSGRFGWISASNSSTLPSGQLEMVSLMGSRTANARRASSSRTSREQSSRTDMSMLLSALDIPIRSQKSRSAAGVTPRRRIPAMVGMRGSSQPSTYLPVTSWISFRFDSTVYWRLRRENSVWRGMTGEVMSPESLIASSTQS
mmetsp:Transcript_21549/g.51868  ORF Transcript_21549/g.51868 Transcript_21549/m.51868 type:complete len:224 (+) Transcript_21549:920-1591(+)